MAVVHEQKIGKTVVRFHDDYCKDTSKEEAKQILQRIAIRAQAELSKAARAEPSEPAQVKQAV